MAATAVYARVASIPTGTNKGTDAGANFQNISTTTAPFTITGGGLFAVSVIGSTFGTVTLQALGPDDTTYLTALTAFSANGYATAYLSPGQYRFAIA